MKFVTYKYKGAEHVGVLTADESAVIPAAELGLKAESMLELIDKLGGKLPAVSDNTQAIALAEVPLLMARLKIACRHVVDYRIAENILPRIGGLDVFCVPADNDAELDLVIKAVADIKMPVDLISRCNGALEAL